LAELYTIVCHVSSASYRNVCGYVWEAWMDPVIEKPGWSLLWEILAVSQSDGLKAVSNGPGVLRLRPVRVAERSGAATAPTRC
jgi:hypothetical protein